MIYPEILDYCKEKNIPWDDEKDNWILVAQKRATTFIDLETYVFYLEIIEQSTFNNTGWKIWFYAEYNDGNCCVFSKEDNSCVIDCFLEKKGFYAINLRNGNNQNQTKSEFEELANRLSMQYSEERYRIFNLHKEAVYKVIKEIITAVSH